MSPQEIWEWHLSLPKWKRWVVFGGVVIVFLFVFVIYTIKGKSPGKIGDKREVVNIATRQLDAEQERAGDELADLKEAMDQIDEQADEARAIADAAARTREESHAAIDAACSGDDVDAVIYGSRADE